MSDLTAVLVPGNMCDARLWRGGGDFLRKTLSRHGIDRVVDADTSRDATIAGMATRALGTAKGALLVIGFSMGAIVALEMVARAPERICGLVLIGLNAGADLPERAAHRPVQQAEVRNGGLERVLVKELKPNYLARGNRADAPLLALLRDMGLSLGADVFIAQSEALRTRSDLRHALQGYPGPILLTCGTEDSLCSPAWHRDWAAMGRDAVFHEIDGSGHMLPLESHEALSAVLDHWLAEKEIA